MCLYFQCSRLVISRDTEHTQPTHIEHTAHPQRARARAHTHIHTQLTHIEHTAHPQRAHTHTANTHTHIANIHTHTANTHTAHPQRAHIHTHTANTHTHTHSKHTHTHSTPTARTHTHTQQTHTHTHTHTTHRRMQRSIQTYCIRPRLCRPHNRPSCRSDGAGGYSRSCSTCTGRMNVVPARSQVALEQKFHILIQHKVQPALLWNCL